MVEISRQPLVSSRTPHKRVWIADGNIHKTHLVRNVIKIRNRITHPQTAAIAFNAERRGFGFVSGISLCCGVWVLEGGAGIRYAAIIEPPIWIPHKSQGVAGEGNSEDTIPNIKAGPALLQKERIRSASDFVNLPLLYKDAAHCAPIG